MDVQQFELDQARATIKEQQQVIKVLLDRLGGSLHVTRDEMAHAKSWDLCHQDTEDGRLYVILKGEMARRDAS